MKNEPFSVFDMNLPSFYYFCHYQYCDSEFVPVESWAALNKRHGGFPFTILPLTFHFVTWQRIYFGTLGLAPAFFLLLTPNPMERPVLPSSEILFLPLHFSCTLTAFHLYFDLLLPPPPPNRKRCKIDPSFVSPPACFSSFPLKRSAAAFMTFRPCLLMRRCVLIFEEHTIFPLTMGVRYRFLPYSPLGAFFKAPFFPPTIPPVHPDWETLCFFLLPP